MRFKVVEDVDGEWARMSERTCRVFAVLPPRRRVTFWARSLVSSLGKWGTLYAF
jgi:hypothetical protein